MVWTSAATLKRRGIVEKYEGKSQTQNRRRRYIHQLVSKSFKIGERWYDGGGHF